MATHDESQIDGLADAIIDSIGGIDGRAGERRSDPTPDPEPARVSE
jgi:hypothetical protein